MLSTAILRIRVFLAAAGLGGVLAALDTLALPLWAQVLVMAVVAFGVLLWTRTPDVNLNGIPDWLEQYAPRAALVIAAAMPDHERSRAVGRAIDSAMPGPRKSTEKRGRVISTLVVVFAVGVGACGHAEVQRPGVRWVVDAPVTTSGECGERYGGDVGCEAEADARAKLEIEVGVDTCFLVAKGLPDWCIPIDITSSLLVSPDGAEAGVCVESPYLRRPVCRSYDR